MRNLVKGFSKEIVDGTDAPNLTDVNGAAGAMDEDGEFEGEEGEEGEELPEVDSTPTIQQLVVGVYHPIDAEEMHTDITATIHTSTGFDKKRLVVTGGVTAKRLGELLQGVATW